MSAIPPAPGGYTCPWCRAVSDPATHQSCPGCGAPVNVATVVSQSGWYELPAIKDMARIQLGQSSVQVEGKYVPVADFNLSGGESVYFTHHVLLWRDPSVTISTMPMRGGWKRLFAGMPLVMTQAHGPGHVAFSVDKPGETVALPIQPGQAVDVREHIFMVATGNVTYDWFGTNVWFTTRNGDETETHYPVGMFMDRFFAGQTPGLLMVHAAGNAFVRFLNPGETILVKPTALLFKDPTVQMQLHFEHPGGTWRSWRSWGNRYLWLRLFGPGRICVESAFEHLHDPGYDLSSSSPASRYQW
jgi:uncharacterized protein (AIM24 family)